MIFYETIVPFLKRNTRLLACKMHVDAAKNVHSIKSIVAMSTSSKGRKLGSLICERSKDLGDLATDSFLIANPNHVLCDRDR